MRIHRSDATSRRPRGQVLRTRSPGLGTGASFRNVILNEDCLGALERLPGESVDLVFADPPYNLSNGGISCRAGKMVSVNKGKWDKSKGFAKDYEFTYNWIKACKSVLKPNGTIWISGTPHNIYQVGYALQSLGFHIMNEISWYKPNAPPNLACRYFAHAHETVL